MHEPTGQPRVRRKQATETEGGSEGERESEGGKEGDGSYTEAESSAA